MTPDAIKALAAVFASSSGLTVFLFGVIAGVGLTTWWQKVLAGHGHE
jgi:hypothetical protein